MGSVREWAHRQRCYSSLDFMGVIQIVVLFRAYRTNLSSGCRIQQALAKCDKNNRKIGALTLWISELAVVAWALSGTGLIANFSTLDLRRPSVTICWMRFGIRDVYRCSLFTFTYFQCASSQITEDIGSVGVDVCMNGTITVSGMEEFVTAG